MIQFRLRQLMEDYRLRTGQRTSYRAIETETGISKTTLSAMASQTMKQVGLNTIDGLLDYFDCEPNDLIVRVKNGQ